MSLINHTHDTSLTSWVASANTLNNDFPIQNLPFAIFRRKGSQEAFRGAVAIGDQVVDLAALASLGLYDGAVQKALVNASKPQLNDLMAMEQSTWSALRCALSAALATGSEHQAKLESILIAQADIEFDLPCRIGDYTDFYTSINHATTIGSIFRPENPLLPNYKWVPIGYHGRSSSITVSGKDFHRPCGQTKAPAATEPSFGPCKRLDYEMEVGIYIGAGNEMGEAIDIDQADQHIFGMCLFNDWSARDLQAWEYQPLGPFLGKNFASTISPWIVTLDALEPFRTDNPEQVHEPLPYLQVEGKKSYDIKLQVGIKPEGKEETVVANSNFKYMYWTMVQQLAHHTVNGCPVEAGDMMGSGTISGPTKDSYGSMLELSWRGQNPVPMNDGSTRKFINDNDTVIMRAHCENDEVRIGFGDCTGKVLPAIPFKK